LKLIFVDIDGTLTMPGENVPPDSALAAIRKTQELGNKVFLCTGRNPDMLKPLLKYNFDGVVGSGGAYVSVGDEVIIDAPMPDEDRDKALDILHKNGVFCTIEAKNGSWCDEGIGEFMAEQSGGNSELMRWRKAIEESLGICSMREYDGSPIYKIVIMCREKDQLEEVKMLLGDRYNFIVQEMQGGNLINGEIISKEYDKGKGVLAVAGHLGVGIDDTYGFGDSMNDREMIEIVGTSVCMENGAEALKKISDMICPSVSEDGLAKAFAQLSLI
jgi:Cof subfamily protein (haloacid dehalogenase superfamily)